jgi:hypothetical protein
MRPATFHASTLRQYLQHRRTATLLELKQALGTQVDQTVFRKLKELGSLTSYSHGGRYYTLRELVAFDAHGLWSFESIWFSRYGTLLATAEALVGESLAGYYAEELAELLQVAVHDALRQLVEQRRLARRELEGLWLYLSRDGPTRGQQLQRREAAQAVCTVSDAQALAVGAQELEAAILLFYSLLDEKQRRLYAGLESLKLGRGGDRRLAQFLGLDAHTVARGRSQLLSQDLELEGVRRAGGGRVALEKKRPK